VTANKGANESDAIATPESKRERDINSPFERFEAGLSGVRSEAVGPSPSARNQQRDALRIDFSNGGGPPEMAENEKETD
jgi:hypothetical protein